MTHDFDRLAEALPQQQLSAAALDQHRRLIAQLADTRPVPPVLQRRWVLVLGAVLGLSGIGVGTAAAFGAFSAPPDDRRTAYCYTTTDLADPTNHLDVAVAVPPGDEVSLVDAANSAMEICEGAWTQGRLSAVDPKVSLDPKPLPWTYPVPPLVACVLPSGAVGILPGDANTCNAIGLPNAEI